MNFLYRFLASYGFNSLNEFVESLFPSYKYNTVSSAATVSTLSGVVSYLFGFGPILAVGMFLAIVVEVWTGIAASRKEGIKFESFRASRCVLKIFIWLAIFFIIHSFEKEFENKLHALDMIAHMFFKVVFLTSMTWFLVEHITSILENLAIIDGKPKVALIRSIKNSWNRFINKLKSKDNG